MKKTLLFFILLISSHFHGQTNVWNGSTDSNWEVDTNWSLGIAPNDDPAQPLQDVVIPSGSIVNLNFGARVNTILIQSNATFTHFGVLRVANTATIEPNVIYNWNAGRFTSGGTINNYGSINLSTASWVFVESGITINNYGNFNMLNGTIYLNDGTINNETSGVIDFQNDNTTIGFSTATFHSVNNYGLIKKSIGSGTASLQAETHNFNNATIQVEMGNLDLSGSKQFDDGSIFNVADNANLTWIYGTTLINGTINGTVNGSINLQTTFTISSSVSLNFTGIGAVNWNSNTFEGAGTLTNNFTFNINTTSHLDLNGNINIVNNGIINFTSYGSLYFNNGTIDNMATGIIDLKSDGQNIYNNATLNLNNYGILKKTVGSGTSSISSIVNNYGTIIAVVGTLDFTVLHNFNTGIVKGYGAIHLPSGSNFTNDGTFAPGMSPGTLTVIGNFTSSTNSVFQAELNGLSQGTESDVLNIQGSAILNGTLQISLGFDAPVNTQFIILSTTGTITECNLPTTATIVYNGYNYNFNVNCVDANKVVLTVVSKTLGVSNFDLNSKNIILYPNPTTDFVQINNNSETQLIAATVIDLNGKIIKIVDLKNKSKISLEDVTSGNYFIQIANENESKVTLKVLKK